MNTESAWRATPVSARKSAVAPPGFFLHTSRDVAPLGPLRNAHSQAKIHSHSPWLPSEISEISLFEYDIARGRVLETVQCFGCARCRMVWVIPSLTRLVSVLFNMVFRLISLLSLG